MIWPLFYWNANCNAALVNLLIPLEISIEILDLVVCQLSMFPFSASKSN